MKDLMQTEGEKIDVRCVELPKGEFARFRPHSKEFYSIVDHKTVLENALNNFATLTEGQSIPIQYEGRSFLVEVVELKPKSAVCIIAEPFLDLKIDFLPAIDLQTERELKEMQSVRSKRRPIQPTASPSNKLKNKKTQVYEDLKRVKKQKMLEKKSREVAEKRAEKRIAIQSRLPSIADDVVSKVSLIKFKFPNGKSLEQHFRSSEKLCTLFDFIDTLADEAVWVPGPTTVQYELATNFPRAILNNSDSQTLEEVGLAPRAQVFVRELIDEEDI